MMRSTLIPDAAYERADAVAKLFGTDPLKARFELQKLADGRIDTALNLGASMNAEALKRVNRTPLEEFMVRTAHLGGGS